MFSKKGTTRSLLLLPVLLVVLVIAAACAAATPETIIVEKEVVKEVEKQVIVEKEVIKEVEKEIVVEKEVVKVIEVEKKQLPPTPIITSIRWTGAEPTSYGEHPKHAAMVKAGTLPSVGARISDKPQVMNGPDGVGKYGPEIRDLHRAADWRNCCITTDGLIDIAIDGSALEPHFAWKWEVSNGFKTHTFYLRPGLKFSDGAPFTTADYKFGFDQTIANKELMPNAPKWSYGSFDELPVVNVIDAQTFSYTWPEPFSGFLRNILPNWKGTGSYMPIETGDALAYVPMHYMQQFTKGFASDADLAAAVKAGGYEDWTKMFRSKLKWYDFPDNGVPVMGPWMNKSGTNQSTVWRMEANPFYFGIDAAGNQLPYLYDWTSEQGRDGEIITLKLIAGRSDHQYRYVDSTKLTLFKLNEDKSGFKLLLLPSTSVDTAVQVNLTHTVDPEITKWMRSFDFRKALSIAIDRDTIHGAVFNTLGEPGNIAPPSISPYYLGPEYDDYWTQYDPAEATKILDGLGLKKDSEGFYLRSDGKGRLQPQLLSSPGGAGGTPFNLTLSAEIVAENWKAIGIDVIHKVGPWPDPFNNLQMFISYGGFSPSREALYQHGAREVSNWFNTNGAEGVAPDALPVLAPFGEMYKLTQQMKVSPTYEEETAIAKQIIEIAVKNMYNIGIHKGDQAGKCCMQIKNKNLKNVLVQPRMGGGSFHREIYFFETLSGARQN